MKNKSTIVALAAVMITGAAFAHANKFIANGWQFAGRDIDRLLQDAEKMKDAPVDGCMLYLIAPTTEGYKMQSAHIIEQPAWKYEYLVPQIEKYRKLFTYPQFKYCFLNSYRAPHKRVAWTDDAAWAKIANNMRVSAKFAKACGFVGLQMDPEDYHNQHQYDYMPEDAPTYAKAAALARQRGREVFKGVFEEFPNVRLLSYWLLTMTIDNMSCIDGRQLREYQGIVQKDLWTHFLDGIFDVLPPEAVMIEGMEHAYTWSATDNAFYRGPQIVKNLVHMVAPENRTKYLTQVQTSFGIYFDGFISTNTGWFWYMRELDGSRVNHLKRNLQQATACADEYIWLWCEKGTWLPPDANGKFEHEGWVNWETALPGVSETIRRLRNPSVSAKTLCEQAEKSGAKPLCANGACIGTGAALPSPYSSWQSPAREGGKLGTFGRDAQVGYGDKSSLFVDSVIGGCILLPQIKDRKPGESFVLSFKSKGKGLSATVLWLKNGKYDWSIPRLVIPITNKPDADGWQCTDWLFTIPTDAEGFAAMLNAGQNVGERAWFDDIKLYDVGR